MTKKFLITQSVLFLEENHQLINLAGASPPITLNVPASRCLSLLIARYPDVVSQEVFLDEVWKKHRFHVSTNTLYQNISLLRKGLVQIGVEDELIKTVSRQGITLSRAIEELVAVEIADEDIARVVNNDVDIEHLSTPPFASLIQRGTQHKPRVIFFNVLAGILLISTLSFWATQTLFDEFLIDDYTIYINNPNKCAIFIPKNATNHNDYADFIKTHSPLCNADQQAWLTVSTLKDRASIVVCDRKTKITDENCYSEFHIGYDK